MTDTWDGKERRKVNSEDHDILIEIRSDLKNLSALVKSHVEDDTTRFNKVDKKIEFQERIIYGAIGAFVFIEFITKVVK